MNKKWATGFRERLELFIALTLAGSLGATAALAQSPAGPLVVPGNGAPDDLDLYQIQQIKITYQKLLLRQKDIPDAVTELGPKQVKAANPTFGSIQTLLKQSPSVVAYTQQPGQNNPTLAIRGVAADQLSETLNGVPINDLVNGSGNALTYGDMGSPVTLNEIDGVTIYPGLAPPAKQGFGTTGGTIAYTTKQPADDPYAELEGGYGSFDTSHFGFVLNSGRMGNGGADAPKALILYDQSETAGYVDNTPAQYHDFMFNGVKPYDNGLSQIGLVIIYNQAKGLVQTLPAPTALIDAVGTKFNYPISLGYYNQADQDLTTILSDKTFINQYAIFNASLFYLHNNTTIDNFASEQAQTTGYPYNGIRYAPNIQGIYNFFGCVGPTDAFSYDPTTYDPTADTPCAAGEEDNVVNSHANTIGFTPQLTLFPDAYNTIVIGGLIAKATYSSADWVYGGTGAQTTQIDGFNAFDYGGGEQRTIYSGYLQDTLRVLDDKLQITPGVTVNAAYSSHIEEVRFANWDYHKLENYTKIGGYYLGASYNLPDNFVLYGSLGKGSLFAPVSDYSQGLTPSGLSNGTNTLAPELVHLYEGGLRYDTPRLLLNIDYYYENISDAFAFFTNFLTDTEYYANNGGELYRGVEGNGEYRVTPNLSIFGNFSYNEAEYTKNFFAFDTLAQDQFGFAFTGTPLSNVPIWTGLIGASYDYGPFSLYAMGQYTGREYTTEDLDAPPYGNTSDAQGNPIPANPLDGAAVTNRNILNPANFIVNLLLSYKIPLHSGRLQSLTADLNVQNLFNKFYYNYTYSAENPVAGIYDPHLPGGEPYNSGFVGQPRSVLIDLTAKF